MSIQAKIQSDLKAAAKKRDELSISILRLLLAEMHNVEIQKRRALTGADMLAVLTQSAKRHQDSIAQFRSGGRQDLAQKEEAELKIIELYLPPALSPEELLKLVQAAVAELRAQHPAVANVGAVMKILMPKVQGRAAGQTISDLVKQELAQ